LLVLIIYESEILLFVSANIVTEFKLKWHMHLIINLIVSDISVIKQSCASVINKNKIILTHNLPCNEEKIHAAVILSSLARYLQDSNWVADKKFIFISLKMIHSSKILPSVSKWSYDDFNINPAGPFSLSKKSAILWKRIQFQSIVCNMKFVSVQVVVI
jgi:hypothetical protein